MSVNLYQVEWHMKATLTWIISLLTVVVCVALIVIELSRSKSYSKATLYVILIAVCGIFATVTAQGTCLRETVNPQFAPEWLYQLGKFAHTNYAVFLENFWPRSLDLLILSDTLNLYVLICLPNKKDELLSKKALAAYFFVVVLVSGTFSGLATKMYHDWHNEDSLANIPLPDLLGLPKVSFNSVWIYDVILKVVVSSLIGGFQIFCTLKIRVALDKAIAFLTKSNATTPAAAAYGKIRRFCFIICLTFGFFHFIVQFLEAGLTIVKEFVRSNEIAISSKTYAVFTALSFAQYVIKIVNCSRPLLYCAAYAWLRWRRADS